MPAYVGGAPFTGRLDELAGLDAWAGSDDPVMVVEAIGGTGKSALSWQWATQRARSAGAGAAGTFWWSFYDGSASMERFLRELLAYVRGVSYRETGRVGRGDLVGSVVHELGRRPFLVVLDGFERLLMAYHKYDPSKVTDDDVDADRRANKHAMIDGLGYEFVRRLAAVPASKILVSTRMVPDALEGAGGGLLPGVRRIRLPGLSDQDTRELLTRLGVTVSAVDMAVFFRSLGNHPLLVAIVAGMVRDHRPAPGDFAAWHDSQPFRIRDVNLAARRHHILAAALDGLYEDEARLLGWLSVLSGSVPWSVLESINPYSGPPDISSARAGALLADALRSLEVRGLLWWNRTANTYDMHPVVRAFVHERLDSTEKVGANQRIRDHFQALPPQSHTKVTSVEDLQQRIALFRALTGAGEHYEAATLWTDELLEPLFIELGANSTAVELLEPYEKTGFSPLRGHLSTALQMTGRYSRSLAAELVHLEEGMKGENARDVYFSVGRLESTYRHMGRLATCAQAVDVLSVYGGADSYLTLRKAVLEALTGSPASAWSVLQELEDGPLPFGNAPWFRSEVRWWKLIVGHRTGRVPAVEEVEDSVRQFPNWRSQLNLYGIKFELLRERGEFRVAKEAADTLDRLRRVGGQEGVPAENACALAALGRHTEAAAAVEQCRAAMPRLEPFDRPYFLLASALKALGRTEEAVGMATLERRRAWADGPRFSCAWELRRAEGLLTELGVALDPLPAADPKAAQFPHQRRALKVLRGG